MKQLLSILLLSTSLALYSQGEQEELMFISDPLAEFPGGQSELYKFIRDNIHFPEIELDSISTTKSYVQFTINVDGSISDIKVVKSSGVPAFDYEAIRVISIMPNWKPAVVQGVPTKMDYTIPFKWRID